MDIELKQAKGDYLGIYEEKKIPFADFARDYLEFAKSTKAPSTYAGNVREMQRLRRAFDVYLPKLTAALIEKYKVQRSQEVMPATVNRELALLKHMLTKAVDGGYLKQNPAKSVKLLKESPGRLRDLEPEEIERLLEACEDPQVPYLRGIVVVALHTGMRLGEILGLRWGDLDLRHRLISITGTKNNERKTIPLNEILYEELMKRPRHLTSPYLFCHPDGSWILRIDRSFHSALMRAGIEQFRFHELRHYADSRTMPRRIVGTTSSRRMRVVDSAEFPCSFPSHLEQLAYSSDWRLTSADGSRQQASPYTRPHQRTPRTTWGTERNGSAPGATMLRL